MEGLHKKREEFAKIFHCWPVILCLMLILGYNIHVLNIVNLETISGQSCFITFATLQQREFFGLLKFLKNKRQKMKLFRRN